MIQFLVHDKKDTVGVAVVDVKAGQSLEGRALDSNETVKAKSLADIPLGHKIALEGFQGGRHRLQVRRRHRQGRAADQGRRTRARA